MRRIPAILSLIGLFVPIALLAQRLFELPSSTTDQLWVAQVTKEQQAVEAVEAVVKVLGGREQIQGTQDCIVQASVDGIPEKLGKNGNIVWKISGQEVVSLMTTSDGVTKVSSGHGHAFRITSSGQEAKLPPHVIRPLVVPPLVGQILLRQLNDSDYSLRFVGERMIGSKSVAIVATASQVDRIDSLVTRQTWYFDSETKLPLRLDYMLPDMQDARHSITTTMLFADYRPIAGVLYPTTIQKVMAGRQTGTIRITSIQAKANVPSTEFDAISGGGR